MAMARVAAALAFALLLQVAAAAPSCTCACSGPGPVFGAAYDGYGLGCGAPAVVDPVVAGPVYAGDAVAVGAPGYAGFATDVVSAAPCGPVPVGAPQVVDRHYGPSSSFVTAPQCSTSKYHVPVTSTTSAVAGPVSESTSVVDGHCGTSCAATRARCGGTTKNVSFKKPTIIDQGSFTRSSISAIGNAVTTRATKAGTPTVATKVIPTCAGYANNFLPYGHSGAVVSGPVVSDPISYSGAIVSGPAVVSGPAFACPAYTGAVVSGPAYAGPAYTGAVAGPTTVVSSAAPTVITTGSAVGCGCGCGY